MDVVCEGDKRASARQIYDHLQMRAPPTVFGESTVTGPEFRKLLGALPPVESPWDEKTVDDTLDRQSDIVAAALHIQRSFRVSKAAELARPEMPRVE